MKNTASFVSAVTGIFASYGIWMLTSYLIVEFIQIFETTKAGYWTAISIFCFGLIMILLPGRTIGSIIFGVVGAIIAFLYFLPDFDPFAFQSHFVEHIQSRR